MKIIKIIVIALITTILLTGCGKNADNIDNNPTNNENNVVENQIFEGLEFVNVGINNNIIKTVIINNTGSTYEGSKISIKIIDSEGNIITEEIEEIKELIETGNTLTIETKVDKDLTNASSIEYSIIK